MKLTPLFRAENFLAGSRPGNNLRFPAFAKVLRFKKARPDFLLRLEKGHDHYKAHYTFTVPTPCL